MVVTDEIVRKLLRKMRNGVNVKFSEEVRTNKELMLALIKRDIFAYRYASLEIRSDKNLALKVLKREGILLDSVAPELRKDREVVLTAVSSYGYALEYASLELQDDRDVVIAAIKRNPRALTYASPRLRKDKDLINLAFRLDGPFIIEPDAFKCFQKIGSEAYRYENLDSKFFKKNKIYEYCLKFSEGKITGTEMMEFQEMLLDRFKQEDKITKLQDVFNID